MVLDKGGEDEVLHQVGAARAVDQIQGGQRHRCVERHLEEDDGHHDGEIIQHIGGQGDTEVTGIGVGGRQHAHDGIRRVPVQDEPHEQEEQDADDECGQGDDHEVGGEDLRRISLGDFVEQQRRGGHVIDEQAQGPLRPLTQRTGPAEDDTDTDDEEDHGET